MSAVIGWAGLVLMAYVLIALFLIDGGAKRALTIASASGQLQSEAKTVLAQSYRTRVRWIRQHLMLLPEEARAIARRVLAVDVSCWVALVALVVLYGSQFFAP